MIATFYAASYPSAGVVNVDQPVGVAFAEMLQQLADRLRGAAFEEIWSGFFANMHTEVLPADAQALLEGGRRPSRDLVLGYWNDVLHARLDVLEQANLALLAVLRSKDVPYTCVFGDEPDPRYREWLAAQLPQATVSVWPGSGHFPHLAYPDRFAELLRDTAGWATS